MSVWLESRSTISGRRMGIIGLFIWLCIAGVNYFATAKVITKAGYSGWWILIPLLPVFLMIATFAVFDLEVHPLVSSGFTVFPSFTGIRYMLVIDIIGGLFTWIMFLVFAFSAWPVAGSSHTFRPLVASGETTGATFGPSGGAPAQVGSGPRTSSPRPGATPIAPQSPGPRSAVQAGRKIVFCAWCGESIPGNRALGHDCGPKDRSEVFCRYCGTAFTPGSTTCAICAGNS
jgi:hypothetical protein